MVAKVRVKKEASRVRMTVRVRVLVSFNGVRIGDEAEVEWTPRVDGWIRAGLVEEVRYGENPSGPGGAEPDDHERVPVRAAGSGEASREPGEDPGAGPDGPTA